MRKRILKEELAYVCAQRNYELARRELRTLKNSGNATEEQLIISKARLEERKAAVKAASEEMQKAGLSKGSI